MSASQRTKGATYEREICDRLSAVVGYKVQRHIGQARDRGNDITVAPFRFECKRRKTLGTIEGWLAQATAGKSSEEIPVVVARSDGGSSLVIMSLEDFLEKTGEEMKSTYMDSDDVDPESEE